MIKRETLITKLFKYSCEVGMYACETFLYSIAT